MVSPVPGDGAIVGTAVATTGASVGDFVELDGAADFVGAAVEGAIEGITDGVDEGVPVTGGDTGIAVPFMVGSNVGGAENVGGEVGKLVSLRAVGRDEGAVEGAKVSFDSVGSDESVADGFAVGTTEGMREGIPVRIKV